MSDDREDDASQIPRDLLPELQAKAELAARKVDLMERRIAAFEDELATLRKRLNDVPAAEAVSGPQARLDDLEARLARVEKRSLRSQAGQALQQSAAASGGYHRAGPERDVPADARALVFASWMPLQATAGEPVRLAVTVDGFEPGDTVSFQITDLAGEPVTALEAKVERHDADQISARWTPPAPPPGGHQEYRFTASCRGREDRSPVLTVRG